MNFRAGLVKAMAVAASVLTAALVGSNSISQSKVNPAIEWREYLGGPERNHYSPLKQINTSNIQKLQVAWTYNSGGADPNNRSQIQCSPIVVDGVLYATSPELHAFALEAATGKEIWKFKHNEKQGLSVNRGVVYWESGGDKRILFSAGMFLFALDARTGKPIPAFGKEGGKIDLRNDLGRDTTGQYVISTTPGTIYKDLIVITTRLSEGVDAAPGHIRAYNVRTGKLAWRFNTIPQPGEFAYETWSPEAYKTIGAANNWAGMAIDRKRGIIYVPTGSAADDFYGANRKGANLFANCLLALDAATGKRLWHFQAVHHDLFDRDFPAPPNLVTVNHNGRKVDAVAQISKQGFVYVFDRVTGKPLFPIEEKPFPASPMPGEEAWPTQPIPAKPAPLVRQSFAEADITPFSAERDALVRKFQSTFSEGQAGSLFTPPSKQGTIIFPGFDGGAEYGGAAIDPNGVMYVNSNEMPWILTMVDAAPKKGQPAGSLGEQLYLANCVNCHGLDRKGDPGGGNPSLLDVPAKRSKAYVDQIIANGKGWMPSFKKLSDVERRALADYLFNEEKELPASSASAGKVQTPRLPFTHTGYNRFVDKDGYPAIKPPWGTLSALDLNTGEYLWKVNLGELKELTARGIPPTGTENYGGPVVTAGGVIFIAATKDEMFRAFDQKTGKVLWETKLPAGGYATPATYQVHGKQYVVIACGGGKMKTKSGDAYVAFALP